MNRSTSNNPAWWGGWSGQRRHEHGFRLNALDILLAAVTLTVCWALNITEIPLWWAPGYLFATFFIFCNVLRITRGYELIWCAVFGSFTVGMIAIRPAEAQLLIPTVGILLQIGLALLAWRSGDIKGFKAH